MSEANYCPGGDPRPKAKIGDTVRGEDGMVIREQLGLFDSCGLTPFVRGEVVSIGMKGNGLAVEPTLIGGVPWCDEGTDPVARDTIHLFSDTVISTHEVGDMTKSECNNYAGMTMNGDPPETPVYVCAVPPMPDLELLTPVADPTNHAVQAIPGPHPHMPHTVTGTMPDGMIYQPQEDRYRKDPKTGITFGHTACFTPELQGRLEQMVLKEKIGFFFPFWTCQVIMARDIRINLKHDNPIFEPARRHGPAEQKLENEKCSEMLAGGYIISPFDSRNSSSR